MERKEMRKSQGGFTLIELVAVLVVLGVLAALAVPRFADLTTSAEVSGAATAASSEANAAAARLGTDWDGANSVDKFSDSEALTDFDVTCSETGEPDAPDDGAYARFTIPGPWTGDGTGFEDPVNCMVTEK